MKTDNFKALAIGTLRVQIPKVEMLVCHPTFADHGLEYSLQIEIFEQTLDLGLSRTSLGFALAPAHVKHSKTGWVKFFGCQDHASIDLAQVGLTLVEVSQRAIPIPVWHGLGGEVRKTVSRSIGRFELGFPVSAGSFPSFESPIGEIFFLGKEDAVPATSIAAIQPTIG